MILTPSAKDVLRHAGIEVYWQEGGGRYDDLSGGRPCMGYEKEEGLNGHKLMIVREVTTNRRNGATFVAADSVGAGIGGAGTGGERQHSQAGHRFR